MAWPSDQDYNEAIQNPRLAFADQTLQSGQVELNAMGIPKARSGNFAAVYKVHVNGEAYAVRCFRSDNTELSIRYPIIASYLAQQNALPHLVSSQYMPQGIRVGPTWYPVVRMSWVEGDSLVSYIQKHLSSPPALQGLAAGCVQMVSDLRQAKIAHGDLQHGNVLVQKGKLRLVDYDGMYVPALRGRHATELGHRNYQHPLRSKYDFDSNLDNFSAWVIYVSLVALVKQPTLWGQLKGGDECLLFRKGDFDAPEHSAAFRTLRALPDAQVRALVDRMEDFLRLAPEQVPAISEQEIAAPSWIQDYVRQDQSPRPQTSTPTALSLRSARIHYWRLDDDIDGSNYDHWTLYSFLDTAERTDNYDDGPIWPTGNDAFGVFFDVRLKPNARNIGFIVHNVHTGVKDTPQDRYLDLTVCNEAWVVSGDSNVYMVMPPPLSPLVKKIARENNISLAQVKGTGAGGRIRREDLEAHLSSRQTKPAPQVTSHPSPPPKPQPRLYTNYILAVGVLIHAISWICPVYGRTSSIGKLRGWQAFKATCGLILDLKRGGIFTALSPHTNYLVVLAIILAVRKSPSSGPRIISVLMMGSCLCNAVWWLGYGGDLRYGYYLWLVSFLVIAVATWGNDRYKAAATSHPVALSSAARWGIRDYVMLRAPWFLVRGYLRAEPRLLGLAGAMILGLVGAIYLLTPGQWWWRFAANVGIASAMNHVGAIYESGGGGARTGEWGRLQKSDQQAADWYRKAAIAGNSDALPNLIHMYEKRRPWELGGTFHIRLPGDEQQLFDERAGYWYRRAADGGNADAMLGLAYLYENGLGGLQKDDAQAVSWYRKADEAGNTKAVNSLVSMYVDSRGGLQRDDSQAIACYRKAADAGNTLAIAELGFICETGSGMQKDDGQAVSWYRRAADAGNVYSMNALGRMYERGRGVEKDYAIAADWYRKASTAGTFFLPITADKANAMYDLARMYEGGRGVEKDEAIAIDWYRKAAKGGNANAVSALRRLSAESNRDSSPPPPTRIQVAGFLQQKKLIRQPHPAYPPLAVKARVQGTVKLSAIISMDGTIQKLDVIEGHPMLVPAALEAVKQWAYQPTIINGKPVEIATQIYVNFELN